MLKFSENKKVFDRKTSCVDSMKCQKESYDTLPLVVCSCLLSSTGLAGAHGMLSILMSQLRALRKALKGNLVQRS